ncbi:ArsR/SmtB family transcription factor [Flavobacterium sp.]|jgi:ArsR family transcriptional regulator|uniref:ArsR/SmtB family transcription factor n=1 Tax=Flavobacterium sp. TaxID=239 RepID=UPI0037C00C7C
MPTTPKSDYFTSEQEQTARFAKALGHPVRIAILELLNSQSCCFHGDMAEELPIAKSTLSQHLNELKDAGLIQGNITPPTVKYCINRNNWEMARSILNELLTPNLEQNIALVLNPEQLMEPKTKRL